MQYIIIQCYSTAYIEGIMDSYALYCGDVILIIEDRWMGRSYIRLNEKEGKVV